MITLNKIRAKLDKESNALLEAKGQMADMMAKINELQQLVDLERTERIKLEHAVKTGSLPDDAKVGLSSSALKFSMTSVVNGKILDFSALAPPPPPPALFMSMTMPQPCAPPLPPCMAGKTGGMLSTMPGIALRKKNVPEPVQPLKSFNWAKLSDNKLKGTIWTDIDESKVRLLLL